MRKAIYLGAALAAVITTSCSSDMDQFEANRGDGNVVVRLQLPDNFATRSFGDGLTATKLHYAVYHSGEKTVATQGTEDFVGLQTTLNLQLVNGVKYDFVFWADQLGNTFYTFDAANQTISVAYDGLKGNDENRDAFFGQLTGQTITGPTSLSATLKRPFAQINLGTSDFGEDAVKAAYGKDLENFTSSMTISTKLPTTLNLLDGKVGDLTTANVFTSSEAAPEKYTETEGEGSGEKFPVDGFDYVSMNYILVDAQKSVVDLEYSFKNNGTEVSKLTLSSVPVQRNYRTNIYGAVLTSPTDINITIDPIFNDPDSNVEVWDGKTVIEPVADENGVYQIKSAAHLAGLAKMVTEDNNNFQGKTVVLNSNIDMGGNILKIGLYIHEVTSRPFNGVFDGNGYTISNFKTNEANELQARYGTGLFPILSGTVKNLTISNAVVGTLANRGVPYGNISGIVAGYLYGYLENVTVENSIIYGYGKVGGLAGMFEGNDKENNRITNCKVKDCTITGTYNMSPGVGLSHSTLAMSGCEFSGNKLVHEDELITFEPTIAVYTKSTTKPESKPASVISGQYVLIGSAYYSTGGELYNYSGFDDYGLMHNGTQKVVDGVPVNNNDGFVELPWDLKKVSETYNELYKSGSEYYISSANGLQQLNDLLDVSSNRSGVLYDQTINIMADIDATGKVWKTVWTSPDSNDMNGFVFNGNGYTISNLAMEREDNNGSGLFSGGLNGKNTTKPAVIKDLTMKNCTSKGGYFVGVIVGQVYDSDVVLENVKVIDCQATGICNVGGLIGSTSLEHSNASATISNCVVTGNNLTANGGGDPIGASAYIGRALVNMGGKTSTITINNSTASNNTFNNAEGLAGGGLWTSATLDNGWSTEVHN